MREWPVLESVILRAGRGGRMMCADRVSGRRPGAAPGTAPVFVCVRARERTNARKSKRVRRKAS